MKYVKNFEEFLLGWGAATERYLKSRRQYLAGIIAEPRQYAIQVTVETLTEESNHDLELLLEHSQYKQFKSSTNRYVYHPANLAIPVMAHYHVYPVKGKIELYAVNVDDGTAHHRVNRGYIVPRKEADELRSLGVKLPSTNILEGVEFEAEELASTDFYTFYIIIDED